MIFKNIFLTIILRHGCRRTGTGTVMDDYDYGNSNDGDENVTAVGSGHRGQWPASSADIIEYDSSAAADTPTPQPQQQHHLQQRTNALSQKPGAVVSARNQNAAGRRANQVDTGHPAGGGPKSTAKWKTRALYVFLACLLAVVVVNLTLTLWFIRVTQFTSVIIVISIFFHYSSKRILIKAISFITSLIFIDKLFNSTIMLVDPL